MAERLITGLAGEFQRWTESIQKMAVAEGGWRGEGGGAAAACAGHACLLCTRPTLLLRAPQPGPRPPCRPCSGKLVGDVLLAAAFVSYASPFNMPLREALVKEAWLPDIAQRGIPMSEGVRPLDMLTDDATKVGGRGGSCSCCCPCREGMQGLQTCSECAWVTLVAGELHKPFSSCSQLVPYPLPTHRPSGPTKGCPPTR